MQLDKDYLEQVEELIKIARDTVNQKQDNVAKPVQSQPPKPQTGTTPSAGRRKLSNLQKAVIMAEIFNRKY